MTRKMKDSGIEWIGEVPEHWKVSKFKYVGKFINGYAFPSTSFKNYGIRVMKISNIQTMNIDWSDESYVDKEFYNKLPQYRVNNGDLVFALTRPIISTGIKAAIVNSNEEILLNQRNALFRGGKLIFSSWIYYIMLNELFIQEFESYIDKTGQQPNISSVDIENIPIPIPSIEEQRAVIEYLDNKCTIIDQTIEKQKQVIEKLKEYKQSIITEAVTKGLNPDVKMKDSGIEWIGEIPKHWRIGKVSQLFNVQLGKMLQPNQKKETDTLEHYMCSANISWLGIKLDVLKQMWFSESEKESYLLKNGDLLVTEGGDVGVACLWKSEIENCYIQNAVHRVREKENSYVKYLYYWLTVLKSVGYIDLICNKATIAHYTKEKFCMSLITIPSKAEQITIADYLDKKCTAIDKSITQKEKLIEKLTEYKKSLIYECVTGKREV